MSQANTKNQATKAADHSSAQLSAEMIKKLIEQSHEAKKQAYCPYSKFRVGSALLTADNRVITGKEHDKLVCFNSRVVGLTLTTRKRSWADLSIRCPEKYLYLLYCKSKRQQPNAIPTEIRRFSIAKCRDFLAQRFWWFSYWNWKIQHWCGSSKQGDHKLQWCRRW